MKFVMIGNEPSGYEKWAIKGLTRRGLCPRLHSLCHSPQAADPSILLMAMTAPVFDHRARKGFGRQCLDEYLLSAVAAEEKKTGMRLLDIVSFHRYPLHKSWMTDSVYSAKG